MSGIIVVVAIILFVVLFVRYDPYVRIQKQADLGMYDANMAAVQDANQAVANDNAPISYHIDSESAKALFNNTVDEAFRPLPRNRQLLLNSCIRRAGKSKSAIKACQIYR